MVTVSFSAFGYGTETRKFKTEIEALDFIKSDSEQIAGDHAGEVVDYGNGEWIVSVRDGVEIARWELNK